MGSPLLPYAQIRDFLPPHELQALLAWVLENEQCYSPATVGFTGKSVVDEDWRIALTCPAPKQLKSRLEQRLLADLPSLMSKVGATGPQPSQLEIEFAAHGDGAFYRPHTDIPIGEVRKAPRPAEDRVLSSVLYFHAEPKAFSGGELRLFQLGSVTDFVEVEPLQNSFVIFHSWVRHEVRPVSVPSGAFHDYRFAINCWFRRTLG